MCLADAKQLMAGKLAFSLEGPAPSLEAIDARRTALDPKFIKRVDRAGDFIAFLCLPFAALTLVSAGAACEGAYLREWATVIGALTCASAGVTLCRWADRTSNQYIEAYVALNGERDDLEPVDDYDCADLLSACRATPEGEAYRQKVLDEHRQFVVAEQTMIEGWARGAGRRAACAALYGTGE